MSIDNIQIQRNRLELALFRQNGENGMGKGER